MWMILLHELRKMGLDTSGADDIPDWIGEIPVWLAVIIGIAIPAAGILLGFILYKTACL